MSRSTTIGLSRYFYFYSFRVDLMQHSNMRQDPRAVRVMQYRLLGGFLSGPELSELIALVGSYFL